MPLICDITNIDTILYQWQKFLQGKKYNNDTVTQDLHVILEIFPHAENMQENAIEFPEINNDIWSLEYFLGLKQPLRFISTKKEYLLLEQSLMQSIEAAGIMYRFVIAGRQIKEFFVKYGIHRYSDKKYQENCMNIYYADGYVVSENIVKQLCEKYPQVKQDIDILLQ